jgi:LysR family transcriptional regulator, benzoate and cis,cis-muconate-responsive activator of ben and cat genes
MSNIIGTPDRYFTDMIPPGLELRHLRYFIAVAEELHFGRAAARLGIAQPPLSQQIQRLEALLDIALFDRTSRRVQLTEAGRALLDGGRRLLSQASDLAETTRRTGRGETGALTVAFAASVMFLSLPTIIRRFRARYPQVHLELREMPTAMQLAALHTGEIDVGFVRQPGRDDSLHIETMMQEPLLIALNRRHPLAHLRRLPLSKLAHEEFVLFPQDLAPGLYDQVFAVCREAGFRPHVVQESRELYTTVSLVEAGLGVTIVPASVQKMGWTGVVYRSISSPLAMSHIAAATRVEDNSPVTKAFIRLARAGSV